VSLGAHATKRPEWGLQLSRHKRRRWLDYSNSQLLRDVAGSRLRLQKIVLDLCWAIGHRVALKGVGRWANVRC